MNKIEVVSILREKGIHTFTFSDGSKLNYAPHIGISRPLSMERGLYMKLRAAIRRYEDLPVDERMKLRTPSGTKPPETTKCVPGKV